MDFFIYIGLIEGEFAESDPYHSNMDLLEELAKAKIRNLYYNENFNNYVLFVKIRGEFWQIIYSNTSREPQWQRINPPMNARHSTQAFIELMSTTQAFTHQGHWIFFYLNINLLNSFGTPLTCLCEMQNGQQIKFISCFMEDIPETVEVMDDLSEISDIDLIVDNGLVDYDSDIDYAADDPNADY